MSYNNAHNNDNRTDNDVYYIWATPGGPGRTASPRVQSTTATDSLTDAFLKITRALEHVLDVLDVLDTDPQHHQTADRLAIARASSKLAMRSLHTREEAAQHNLESVYAAGAPSGYVWAPPYASYAPADAVSDNLCPSDAATAGTSTTYAPSAYTPSTSQHAGTINSAPAASTCGYAAPAHASTTNISMVGTATAAEANMTGAASFNRSTPGNIVPVTPMPVNTASAQAGTAHTISSGSSAAGTMMSAGQSRGTTTIATPVNGQGTETKPSGSGPASAQQPRITSRYHGPDVAKPPKATNSHNTKEPHAVGPLNMKPNNTKQANQDNGKGKPRTKTKPSQPQQQQQSRKVQMPRNNKPLLTLDRRSSHHAVDHSGGTGQRNPPRSMAGGLREQGPKANQLMDPAAVNRAPNITFQGRQASLIDFDGATEREWRDNVEMLEDYVQGLKEQLENRRLLLRQADQQKHGEVEKKQIEEEKHRREEEAPQLTPSSSSPNNDIYDASPVMSLVLAHHPDGPDDREWEIPDDE